MAVGKIGGAAAPARVPDRGIEQIKEVAQKARDSNNSKMAEAAVNNAVSQNKEADKGPKGQKVDRRV